MAYIGYVNQFIQSDLSFSFAFSNLYSRTFGSQLNNFMINGNYQDVYRVFYAYNGFDSRMLAFAGHGMVSDLNGIISKGTVTGYYDVETMSGSPYRPTDPYFFDNWDEITGISISAKSMYKAALTLSNSDDLLLLNSALKKDDIFILSSFNDNANGFAGNDHIYGNAGSDYLNGGSGNDSIDGGIGNDTLIGGTGQDYLTGNDYSQDTDIFVFNAVSETSNSEKTCDVITDFFSFNFLKELEYSNGPTPFISTHKIDLSSIDASTKISGNNAFVFNGTTAFGTSKSGEIYYKQFDNGNYLNDYTIVYIDNDGDAASESIIKLTGLVDLTAYDFIL